MQGNSLLESFEGIDLSHLTVADSMFDDENDIQYLVNMLGAYFDKHEEKAAIRDAIKVSVLDLVKKRGIGNKTYDALSKLDLHANSEFFLWHDKQHNLSLRKLDSIPSDLKNAYIGASNYAYYRLLKVEYQINKVYDRHTRTWRDPEAGRGAGQKLESVYGWPYEDRKPGYQYLCEAAC